MSVVTSVVAGQVWHYWIGIAILEVVSIAGSHATKASSDEYAFDMPPTSTMFSYVSPTCRTIALPRAPNGEVSGVRTALAMGAAKAVLVSDPELAGSDALTTAKVLAAALDKLAPDVALMGMASDDARGSLVPGAVAAMRDVAVSSTGYGSKRYPMPASVTKWRGADGSSSSLRRRFEMKTSIVFVIASGS